MNTELKRTVETSMEVPHKTESRAELPYDPKIPLLGIYMEKTNSKRHKNPNVHCSTIYKRQVMEAT